MSTNQTHSAKPAFTNHMVEWFRHSAPYIHSHRDKTFVIMLPGDAIESPNFADTVADISLLNSLGVRLVLACGARSQIDAELACAGITPKFHAGIRITDEPTLARVVAAASGVRSRVEALLSSGLINSPMHGARVRVASGNLITAKPIGVRDGIDFHYTGEVRRIDTKAINRYLDDDAIVVLPCLGYSASGEIFNVPIEQVAAELARALKADKVIAFIDAGGVQVGGELARELQPQQAAGLITAQAPIDQAALRACLQAVDDGCGRAHLISYREDGALLAELFTREGAGTLICRESAESIRPATLKDVGGILELIRPLEENGVLVRRSREMLELDIQSFTVIEHEGVIAACIALYPYPEASMAEIACVATHPHYRTGGRAAQLLAHAEQQAAQQGISKTFVLTTQTEQWFVEKGYQPASLNDLPEAKKARYNRERNSKIFIKSI